MSGGVDSSVAAKLLTDAGFSCIGCTMKLYDNEDAGIPKANTCCSLDDVEDARSVAYRLGMPYYVFNLKDKFAECVIDRFVDAYEHGITPNPCIDCNRYLKFDKLFERADIMGCRYIATGHYARIEREGEKYVLKKALDETKDQSYVLYMLTQAQLARIYFPLGDKTKREVRELALSLGLAAGQSRESQDICFIPDGDYRAYLERERPGCLRPGNFVSVSGEVLGRHKGTAAYTVGQRRGLGVSAAAPLYVVGRDVSANTVILGGEADLYRKRLRVRDVSFLSGRTPSAPMRVTAKLRYSQKPAPATVWPEDGGAVVEFDKPERAVSPGQAAVFYEDDYLLGGGTICAADEGSGKRREG